MKNICSLPLLFLGLCLSAFAGAQAGVKLLVTTDMDCNWKLDGQPMVPLKADDHKVVPVSSGEHLVQAATTDGVVKIRIKVEVDQGQNTVEIHLRSRHDQKLKMQQAETARKQAEADVALHPTWTDPDTGLMWTKKDNGSDVNWSEATFYCRTLSLGSHANWRLPNIDELKGIYDQSAPAKTLAFGGRSFEYHIKGGIILTGREWSATLARLARTSPGALPPAGASTFNFSVGEPVSFQTGSGDGNRALCVRRSGQ